MITSDKIIRLIDDLQAELDYYIEDHEVLAHDYASLLEENETLRDRIAELMRQLNGPERN